MQIIYPSDYFDRKKIDETFEQEFHCFQKNNIRCQLLSSVAMSNGRYEFSQPFEPDIPVIWRGWMLNLNEYQQLFTAVSKNNGHMLTSVDSYLRCHHITGWYEHCVDFTPETVFTDQHADFSKLTAQLQWPAYFVKDYVKSLTTSRGSVAKNDEEIREIIGLIEHFRGNIEGGISLRRFENFIPESEHRYFVLKGKVFSPNMDIPETVTDISQRINSPFFSIDMATNTQGQLRLIEIGDGQVSDTKEWPIERFVHIFR